MEQQISLTAFIKDFLWNNFWHINGIAWLLIILFILFSFFWVKSIINKELSTPSKFAPSVMTAAGLLGTFIGLTFGLKDLNLQEQASMQELINGLKLVFVYSLVGVFSAILFMLLNMIPTAMQNRNSKIRSDHIKQDAKAHNQHIISLQKNQADALNHLIELQRQQLDNQKLMQQDIAKLQFDNNNEELGRIITQGIVNGLSPLLMEIKTAVADQGTEAIKKVLEDLKIEILIPMKGALDNTNTALETTNQAVKDTISAIEESQQHNTKLIAAVGEASEKMQTASEKMNGLVDKIDSTVQHMDEIQTEQRVSLDRFNTDLQENLSRIQPAIEKGLETASTSLTTAIGAAALLMQTSISNASNEMVKNIHAALDESGQKLEKAVTIATTELTRSVTATIEKQNESINESFKQFDAAQDKFDKILTTFSHDMNGHLDRMATELEAVGRNAENMINSASNNLEKTLGDIDNKLLNTAKVLEVSLETFRIQYQESLTEYLNQQTESLNGFLDRQNEQLEQTIGEQRKGLVEITNNLTEQFKFMDAKQREVNTEINRLVSRIEAIQEAIIPKVQSIAKELNKGEEILSRELRQSTEHLTTVSQALENMGRDLPEEFAKAFKELDKTYQDAFKDLDSGLKHAVNNLGSAVTGVNTALSALTNAVQLHDTLNQH